MIYEVRINPISGCQELVSLAGVESSTIGCVWKSTDAYACITDCADCSLGMINNAATQLGYTASASNSSTAIGLGATACCTSTAIGNGACAIGNNEIHIKGGSAEVISKCNCINISNGGSTAIDVSDTALNVCSEANIYLNVACDCIDIKGCTAVVNVDTNKVSIGASVTNVDCSVVIGANATGSVVCSTAIGYCAAVTGNGVAIGAGARATSGIAIGRASSSTTGVAIGRNASAAGQGISIGGNSGLIGCNTGSILIGEMTSGSNHGIAIGCSAGSSGCYGVAIGYSAKANCNNVIAIGHGVSTDTDCAGDTFIGCGSCVFKFCGATGYTYGNGCMMTGRILNCAAELPATNCSLLLYYVP